MQNKSTLIKFSVASFRRIISPRDEERAKTYIAVVNVRDVPEVLEEWRGLNVRDPRLSSGVAQRIEETLRDNPPSFFFRNRGITLITERASFDNQRNILEIEMVDPHRHGLLDGGHTFRVIRNFVEGLNDEERGELDACVKIEILEGVRDIEEVVAIVEARNTSTQVKEQSIQELLGRYEEIKKVLTGKPYADHIAYKEFELLEDGSKKTIDVKEILSYLICFDIDSFDDRKHPIRAYSTKSAVVEHFRDNLQDMSRLIPLLPQILELHDAIYLELPDAYNSLGGKFGKLTGVMEVSNRRMSKVILPFTMQESSYRIPSGFIYPVLAAFRNLVNCGKDKCTWKSDPLRLFRDLKAELASRVGEPAKELRNPNKLGKDAATWGRCYDLVQLEVLKRNL